MSRADKLYTARRFAGQHGRTEAKLPFGSISPDKQLSLVRKTENMADSRSKENRRERGKRGALSGDGDRGLCRGKGELVDVVETPGVNDGLDRKE